MDSLATDIKKIFGEDGAMGCQEIYAGKSIAYKALKRLFFWLPHWLSIWKTVDRYFLPSPEQART